MKKINVRLLRRVKKVILEEPLRIDMDYFIQKKELSHSSRKFPSCGTIGCIAGWAVMLSNRKRAKWVNYYDGAAKATKLLGITPSDAKKLFCGDGWPVILRKKLESFRPQTKKYAQVVAERIEHFIKHRE